MSPRAAFSARSTLFDEFKKGLPVSDRTPQSLRRPSQPFDCKQVGRLREFIEFRGIFCGDRFTSLPVVDCLPRDTQKTSQIGDCRD